ncbi:MAG: DinB family protein [Candidatus Thorarchaeota archaeon]
MNLKDLGDYHEWSSMKIRSVIEQLSDEEYELEIEGRSIHGISMHIVMALETCFLYAEPISNGQSVYEVVETENRKDLMMRWIKLDYKFKEILLETMERSYNVEHMSEIPFTLKSKDFYFQYLLHTTYHRGQLALLLRSLGKEVPGTDYLFYFADKSSS